MVSMLRVARALRMVLSGLSVIRDALASMEREVPAHDWSNDWNTDYLQLARQAAGELFTLLKTDVSAASVRAWQGFKSIPSPFRRGMAALTVALFGIWLVSFTIGSVIVKPAYNTIALAKPAVPTREKHTLKAADFGSKVSSAFGVNGEVATEFADWILEASERQELPPELLASLVVTESSFRKGVRSHVGAVGPTQVRPEYWGDFCGDNSLTDPEQNVYCGAQVLSHFLERCDGDYSCALAAYNVGPKARLRKDGVAAAQRYVNKIDNYRSSLESL